jgi:hypothetical protein
MFDSIRGERASSLFATARASRQLFDALDLEADLTYVHYEDHCPAVPMPSASVPDPQPPNTTCTGTLTGQTLRGGALLAYRDRGGSLFLVDYHVSWDAAKGRDPGTGMDAAQPSILSHTVLLRAQHSF